MYLNYILILRIGPGLTQVSPSPALEFTLALGPQSEGWSLQVLAQTWALENQAGSALGPRASGPARGQSRDWGCEPVLSTGLRMVHMMDG